MKKLTSRQMNIIRRFQPSEKNLETFKTVKNSNGNKCILFPFHMSVFFYIDNTLTYSLGINKEEKMVSSNELGIHLDQLYISSDSIYFSIDKTRFIYDFSSDKEYKITGTTETWNKTELPRFSIKKLLSNATISPENIEFCEDYFSQLVMLA